MRYLKNKRRVVKMRTKNEIEQEIQKRAFKALNDCKAYYSLEITKEEFKAYEIKDVENYDMSDDGMVFLTFIV
jgi:hypothetical protein